MRNGRLVMEPEEVVLCFRDGLEMGPWHPGVFERRDQAVLDGLRYQHGQHG